MFNWKHELWCRHESNDVAGTGNSICTHCGVGHFASSIGLAQCEACGPGSYVDEIGATACDLCGIG
jgi:hypothetical protein